jgi:hypothetical protein
MKKETFDLTTNEVFALETQIAVLRSFPNLPMDLANDLNSNWPTVKKITKKHQEAVELIDERAKTRKELIEAETAEGKALDPKHKEAEERDAAERLKLDKAKHKLQLNVVPVERFKDEENKTIQITGDKQVGADGNRVMVFSYRDAYYFLQEMGLISLPSETPGPKRP